MALPVGTGRRLMINIHTMFITIMIPLLTRWVYEFTGMRPAVGVKDGLLAPWPTVPGGENGEEGLAAGPPQARRKRLLVYPATGRPISQ